MKKFIFIAACILLFAGKSQAEENQANPVALPEPIYGTTRNGATIGETLSNFSCSFYNSTPVLEDKKILIIGLHSCEQNYPTKSHDFYKVPYKGEVYYVKTSDIKLDESDLDRLKNLTEKQLTVYQEAGLNISMASWLGTVDKAYKRLINMKKHGIVILKSRIYDVSEHTEGTGFDVTYYNPTKKTIKYVTSNLVGYNAVGDPVRGKKGTTQVTVRGIGPIEPDSSAEYTHDYAWFTDLVEKYKIVSIKVQYMDGTSTTVKTPHKAWLDSYSYDVITEYRDKSRRKKDTDTK